MKAKKRGDRSIISSNWTKLLFLRVKTISKIKNAKKVFALRIISNLHSWRSINVSEQIMIDLEAGNFISREGVKSSSRIHEKWRKADYLFGRGDFLNAQMLRKQVFSELYEEQGIRDCGYFPPFVSSAYTVSIGHLGALFLNNIAQDLGILAQGTRVVLTEKRIANTAALEFLTEKTIPVEVFNPSSMLVLSSLIENYQIIKSVNGFVDKYELWEEVFRKEPVRKRINHLFLNEKTRENFDDAQKKLKSFGVDTHEPIALFHLRDNGRTSETRNVDSSTFYEAVQYLYREGYQICQIGANSRNTLAKKFPYVLSLGEGVSFDSNLNFFLLANASIFIGTTSGPSIFPTLFGIPSLITNLTAASRNTFSSKNALYLPKLIRRRNQAPFKLEEFLQSRFSYGGEFLHQQFRRANLSMIDNNSEEILEALKELTARISGGSLIDTYQDLVVNEIRKQLGAPSYGYISNTFLERHQLL